MASITVGSSATDRGTEAAAGSTLIEAGSTASVEGTISTVQIYKPAGTLQGIKVGTFYPAGGMVYTCRDSVTLANITTEGLSTITTDIAGDPLAISIHSADYIGIYYDSGSIDMDVEGGTFVFYYIGEIMDADESEEFTGLSGYAISLYGTGTTGGTKPMGLGNLSLANYRFD